MESHERPAGWGTARASAGLSHRTFIQRSTGVGALTLLGACSGRQVAPPSPTTKLRRIGWLSGNARASVDNLSKPFLQELRALGYVDGRDITVDFRSADNANERLPAMAKRLGLAIPDSVLRQATEVVR